jgi:hypothetical protein
MSNMPSNDSKLRVMLHPSVIEAELRRRRAAFVTLFPDSGPLGREFYQKHLEFFAAGAKYKERLFMGGQPGWQDGSGSVRGHLSPDGPLPALVGGEKV